MAGQTKPGLHSVLQSTGGKTEEMSDSYLTSLNKIHSESQKKKESPKASSMVNHFYDIATDFYEYGWGDSFHFFKIGKHSSFKEDVLKHEHYLAEKLVLTPDDVVLDLGCGVGGPARNIAKFSKAKITGINNNDYQIERARILTEKAKLAHLCSFEKGDFTELRRDSNSVDKIYAIEATCHCSDKAVVYGEAYRLLRPGGLFAVYEWVLRADKYDPQNPDHVKISQGIQVGNGLPLLDTDVFAIEKLREVGFDVLESEDLALQSEVPWETPLLPSMKNLKASPVGRSATHAMLFFLEKLGISPKGSTKIHSVLCNGADALVKGAKFEIFTPMLFLLARKPENKD